MTQFEIFAGNDWSTKFHQVAVAAAIEKPHGPEVDALLERGVAVLAPGPSSSTVSPRPEPRTTGGTPSPWSARSPPKIRGQTKKKTLGD